MKRILLLTITILLLTVLTYKLGYRNGCAKVIGKWETTHLNDLLLESHCYGESSMWRDDVDRKMEKK